MLGLSCRCEPAKRHQTNKFHCSCLIVLLSSLHTFVYSVESPRLNTKVMAVHRVGSISMLAYFYRYCDLVEWWKRKWRCGHYGFGLVKTSMNGLDESKKYPHPNSWYWEIVPFNITY